MAHHSNAILKLYLEHAIPQVLDNLPVNVNQLLGLLPRRTGWPWGAVHGWGWWPGLTRHVCSPATSFSSLNMVLSGQTESMVEYHQAGDM